ncbi:MAG: hypothetical protein LKF33_09675 [Prevotella sp.]|jgi:hypothetical protein|nr:hypothetical protein [Prevotella sp.]
MKKIINAVLLSLTFLIVFPISALAEDNGINNKKTFNWNPVMDAIIQVESQNNRFAQSGNSVGAMQITPILVVECNSILRSRKIKKRYKLSDRFNIRKSKEMFLLFQSKYNPQNNIEKAIRSWNGGLNYSIKYTQRYFEKVMNLLK